MISIIEALKSENLQEFVDYLDQELEYSKKFVEYADNDPRLALRFKNNLDYYKLLKNNIRILKEIGFHTASRSQDSDDNLIVTLRGKQITIIAQEDIESFNKIQEKTNLLIEAWNTKRNKIYATLPNSLEVFYRIVLELLQDTLSWIRRQNFIAKTFPTDAMLKGTEFLSTNTEIHHDDDEDSSDKDDTEKEQANQEDLVISDMSAFRDTSSFGPNNTGRPQTIISQGRVSHFTRNTSSFGPANTDRLHTSNLQDPLLGAGDVNPRRQIALEEASLRQEADQEIFKDTSSFGPANTGRLHTTNLKDLLLEASPEYQKSNGNKAESVDIINQQRFSRFVEQMNLSRSTGNLPSWQATTSPKQRENSLTSSKEGENSLNI
jgi:hypothetical protein